MLGLVLGRAGQRGLYYTLCVVGHVIMEFSFVFQPQFGEHSFTRLFMGGTGKEAGGSCD